jgi:hypothetical protein
MRSVPAYRMAALAACMVLGGLTGSGDAKPVKDKDTGIGKEKIKESTTSTAYTVTKCVIWRDYYRSAETGEFLGWKGDPYEICETCEVAEPCTPGDPASDRDDSSITSSTSRTSPVTTLTPLCSRGRESNRRGGDLVGPEILVTHQHYYTHRIDTASRHRHCLRHGGCCRPSFVRSEADRSTTDAAFPPHELCLARRA